VLAVLDKVGLKKTLGERTAAAPAPANKLEAATSATQDPLLSLVIEPYGENLSVGQRQLVCIARGMLKR